MGLRLNLNTRAVIEDFQMTSQGLKGKLLQKPFKCNLKFSKTFSAQIFVCKKSSKANLNGCCYGKHCSVIKNFFFRIITKKKMEKTQKALNKQVKMKTNVVVYFCA